MCFLFVQCFCGSGVASSMSTIQSCLAPRPNRTAELSTRPRHLFGPPAAFNSNSTSSPRLYESAFSSITSHPLRESVFHVVHKVFGHRADAPDEASYFLAADADTFA